jgi:signal transduction histidine kinase
MLPSTNRTPSWFAVMSIIVLLLALGAVGIVGVVENTRLQDSSEQAIRYDVAVAAAADDIRVDIFDLRYHHRNIVFSGPTDTVIADFDQTYAQLLNHIDALDTIGIADLAVPQPADLRALVQTYHDAFRPSIVLFTSDPIAFNTASATGLSQIDQLEAMTEQIDAAGNNLTTASLADVEHAARRERLVLIALLGGVALVGVLISLATSRVLQRLHDANAAEIEANQGLASALRMKTDFIADASHELRTPLTLIRGNAEIALAEPVAEERTAVLADILGEATRMTRLVDDLLFLARSDAGSPPIEREYMPARVLLARLEAPAQALTRHHGIPLVIDLHGDGHIEADSERIQQAVLILLDNAIRYTPPGADIALRSYAESNHLWIAVRDSGPGISAEEQALIFERFYQARDASTRVRGGAGLGLAIAKSIVENHGGQITVVSSPDPGTSIAIGLPLVRPD